MAGGLQVGERLCLQITLLLYFFIPTSALAVNPVLLDATVFTPVYVSQYMSYSDVSVFKFTVPDMATNGRWALLANRTGAHCPVVDIVMTLQSGGYPVINPRNESFPADFYLKRSNLQHVRLKSNAVQVDHVVTSPVPGTWYAVAYAVEDKSRVIKKMTDPNCRFTLAVNFTVKGWEMVPEILTGNLGHPQHFRLLPNQTVSYLRFHINRLTWAYDVNVTGCQEAGAARSPCPLSLYARSTALPTSDAGQSINCSGVAPSAVCRLHFVGPVTDSFQYIKILKHTHSNLNFSISVGLKVCGALPSSFFESDRARRQAEMGDIVVNPVIHKNYRDTCVNSMQLFRTTEVASNFVTTYALRPSRLQFVENLVLVASPFVRVFHFDIKSQQDTGGTLRFSFEFNVTAKAGSPTVYSNITACLQRGEIPVRGIVLRCHPDNIVYISNERPALKVGIRRIPYPEEGMWYLALQQNCYYYNTTNGTRMPAPCSPQLVLTKFDLRVTACLDQGCGDYGDCREYFSAGYAFSVCTCKGGVMGYACDDWSAASSRGIQMLNTLLLTMSNLFFIPAIILSVIRARYSEAVVYLANMFFSTFYHACDMGPWSVYRLCIMPYGVLQHLDFFCSILSFWVTLIAVAELRGPLYSLSHMVGAIMLAMAVDWRIHGLLPYLIPIVLGLVIVVASLGVKSYCKKRLYPGKWRLLQMLPGLLLSVLGICIFCFIETDNNYPYTHSGWHFCMSLCILFFLPKKHLVERSNQSCGSSSSDDSILLFHQETNNMVSLTAADSIGNHDDDDDDKDDQLLQDF